jgi:hypothetical protein
MAETSATANIGDQIDDHDGYCISLGAMWRAVGSPDGKDPQTWAKLAEPLFPALATYFNNLDVAGGDCPTGMTIVEEATDDSTPHIQAGDLLTIQFVANVYAAFLDDGRPVDRRRGLSLDDLGPSGN